MNYLTLEQVIQLHDKAISEAGGLEGIRDLGLLESALSAPLVYIFGMEMYPTLQEKGAVYLYHLIKNHPFNDANKRTAFITTCTFFEINGNPLTETERLHLENLCISIADGTIEKNDLIAFFKQKK